jgi:ribosomal protein S3
MGKQIRNTRQYAKSSGRTAKLVKSPQVTINVIEVNEPNLNARV